MPSPGDDAVAVIVQDWLRQRGYVAASDEPVVPLGWLRAELDRLTAELEDDRDLPLGYDMWGKGWAAALRTIRGQLPSERT